LDCIPEVAHEFSDCKELHMTSVFSNHESPIDKRESNKKLETSDIDPTPEQQTALRQATQVAVLQAISLDISSGLTLGETLRRIVVHAVNLLDSTGGGVYLTRPDGSLEMMAVYGIPESLIGLRVAPNEGLAGRIIATQQALSVTDFAEWDQALPDLQKTGVAPAAVGVPLIYQDRIVGVLTVVDTRQGRNFDKQDEQLLAAIAPQAAVATVNAELFSRAYQLSQRLSVLLTTGLEISTHATNRTQVLSIVCERVISLFGCGGCSMWLWNPVEQRLNRVEAHFIDAPPLPMDSVAMGQELPGRALLQGRPIAESDADNPNVHRIALPMYWQMRPVGVLVAAHGRSGARFERDDIDLLALFSQSISAAITNADLFNTLQREHDRLDAILNSTLDPVLVTDVDLNLLMSNPVTHATLGSQPNRNLLDIFGPLMMPPEDRETLKRSFSGGEPFSFNLRLDNTIYSANVAPLRQQERGWVLVLRDVTHLQEVDELKSRMIHMMSHDLKNPLTGIMGLAQMLSRKADNLTPRQQEYVSNISHNAVRMEELINAILDLERAEGGTSIRQPVGVETIFRRLVGEYDSQIKGKSQLLALRLPDDVPVIYIDEVQIYQALSNLLSNAIKYTPESGQITVDVYKVDKKIHIAVTDTGYGIPKDAQPRLFERFYKVRTRKTAHIPGTGLGLSLVKAVAEAHGGNVWVESEEDRGSIFHVELPIQQDNI
jgi:signal transduction histidine kinase/putative methionine-R-sulfoxide reductase with GAF domain